MGRGSGPLRTRDCKRVACAAGVSYFKFHVSRFQKSDGTRRPSLHRASEGETPSRQPARCRRYQIIQVQVCRQRSVRIEGIGMTGEDARHSIFAELRSVEQTRVSPPNRAKTGRSGDPGVCPHVVSSGCGAVLLLPPRAAIATWFVPRDSPNSSGKYYSESNRT